MENKTVDLLVKTIESKHGEHIAVLDFANEHPFYDYFIICDASNARLTQAIADHVIDTIHQEGLSIHHIERNDAGDWILIDCYEVVVHIFLQEQREHYKLEKLWKDHLVNYA